MEFEKLKSTNPESGLIGFRLFRYESRIFYSRLELNNNYLYSFGHKEIVDFLIRLLNCFLTDVPRQ